MKYCGVATPFKGIRVYQRSAMGMPGSETCLEELMSRILGHLVQEGCVAKLADDLYVGGDTPEEALHNWSRVLKALDDNNLRLSAAKTVVCPKSVNILGWVWRQGTLTASPHKVSALEVVEPPTTVHGLRSFIGAYKVLSRVLKGYAVLLHPLEHLTAGKASRDRIIWTDDLRTAFRKAQSALQECDTITLPSPEDELWIVTDASVKNNGIAATLYCRRDEVLKLGGHFNAKLKQNQITWLPCEVEALCIGAAIKHFAPYIVQSKHQAQVLTDSRPCVQAVQKLQRGEFSNSARVSSFLTFVSRYQLTVRHIAGVANLPSDFTSRHPVICQTPDRCQICKFIQDIQESVVYRITIQDVIQGIVKMPFSDRPAWLETQQECPDMRRCCAHLQQGTRPSKKAANVHDVRRYLGTLKIAHDGLLVIHDAVGFSTVERIAVPTSVLHGLITALHITFNHPTQYQMERAFCRTFFALDLKKAIADVTDTCHHCNALKYVPPPLCTQSSEPSPDSVGVSFAADVLKRSGQLILVFRETVSSYTLSTFIDSEKHEDLRGGLLVLSSQVRSLNDSGISIRVDSAPGLIALKTDPLLAKYGITLVFGEVKNKNKNPVAERAIQELTTEILHIQPQGGSIDKVTLALATGQLNERIRKGGLSAKEVWTQRDQITGAQLPFKDSELLKLQETTRSTNHPVSAMSKLHGHSAGLPSALSLGDLVYLKQERSKLKAREKYLIVAISGEMCSIRKFTESHFRARTYNVPLYECYPVMPTLLPPKKDHVSDSSDDGLPPEAPPPVIPAAINQPLPDEAIPPDIPVVVNPQLPDEPIPPDIDNAPGDGDPAEAQQREGEMEEMAAAGQPPPGGVVPIHAHRRSARARKPNPKYTDNLWDMRSESSDSDNDEDSA